MKITWKINWNLAVIFLLIGFASGAIFGPWVTRENFHRRHGKHGGMKQHMLQQFNRELHLTSEQKAQVSAIFDAKHPQMVALQSEMQPKFEALRNATQVEIRKLLDADQQKKFDEMNDKMEERRKDREKFF